MILRVWKQTGYLALLFLAGLQSIPAVLYEAAAVDGANAWHRFRHITLPLLMPTLAFVVIITTLGAFLTFTEVYVMTESDGTGDVARRAELLDPRDVVLHLHAGDPLPARGLRQRPRR